ncbi:unnamed protein product [Caenorhabditis sp. 36 PRJEB53466]|nr:unnamed protein product [Caenorhabditis sp. 36 PRJEB53466]
MAAPVPYQSPYPNGASAQTLQSLAAFNHPLSEDNSRRSRIGFLLKMAGPAALRPSDNLTNADLLRRIAATDSAVINRSPVHAVLEGFRLAILYRMNAFGETFLEAFEVLYPFYLLNQ